METRAREPDEWELKAARVHGSTAPDERAHSLAGVVVVGVRVPFGHVAVLAFQVFCIQVVFAVVVGAIAFVLHLVGAF